MADIWSMHSFHTSEENRELILALLDKVIGLETRLDTEIRYLNGLVKKMMQEIEELRKS